VTAAFANADGGILVLGVEDDGMLTGHALPDSAVEDMLVVPERRLTPALGRGERAVVEGVEVLVFEVESAATPVMVQGNGYPCRVGDTVVRIDASKIAAWKEQGLVETWEARRSDRQIADLEPKLLQAAIAGSGLAAPTLEQYLLRRRLADVKGQALVLRRAAELLFAREPHLIDHPNAGVRVFRVIGTERKLGAQHNVEELPRFEGNLAGVLDAVMSKIQNLLRRPKRLRGLRFEESPEYPTFAWQEAIVNAVAHRDYGLTGRCVEVWLYDDRMEVTSPGGLVAEVSVEALHQRERVHMSRNPRLVRGLVDLGLMREQGEGIPRMFAEMEVQFLSPPELRATPHEFSVTLRNAPTISPADAEWLASLQAEPLSDGQARAMALARIRGQVSNADLRDATGLDTLAASVELRDLRDRKLLELRGAGSASFYVVGSRAEALAHARTSGTAVGGHAPLDEEQTGGLPGQNGGLPDQNGGFDDENRGVPDASLDPAALLAGAPAALRTAVANLGGKPAPADLRSVIVQLCELRWWTPRELAAVLGRKDTSNLSEKHLSPLVKEGRLERRYPDNLAHPSQAYRAVQPSLLGSDGGRIGER
jgi:ATP-dependent DNA helicase RecG